MPLFCIHIYSGRRTARYSGGKNKSALSLFTRRVCLVARIFRADGAAERKERERERKERVMLNYRGGCCRSRAISPGVGKGRIYIYTRIFTLPPSFFPIPFLSDRRGGYCKLRVVPRAKGSNISSRDAN